MSTVQGQMLVTFPAERGAASATLRVSSFPSLDRAVHSVLPRWKALHPDVAIEVGTRRIREHHEAMAQALSDPEGPIPDVIGLSMDYLGWLAPLGFEALEGPPHHAERWLAELVPELVEQARSPDGALVAIPADLGPAVLFYRADLLERAGVEPAGLGASWESFLDAGRKLTAATGARLLAHPIFLKDYYLRVHQARGEGLHFSRAGEPLVRSARHREAFRLAVAARAAGVDLGVEPGWTDAWKDGVRDGTIAAQLSGPWFLAHLGTWVAPETRGLWRTCAGPDAGGGTWGGAFYGIPRRAANRSLAFDFIRLACFDRDVQLSCFLHSHAYPALLAAQDAPSFDEPLPFLGGQRARRLWQELASRIHPGPVHPLDPLAEAAVTDQLCLVLEGKDVDRALSDAERAILNGSARFAIT